MLQFLGLAQYVAGCDSFLPYSTTLHSIHALPSTASVLLVVPETIEELPPEPPVLFSAFWHRSRRPRLSICLHLSSSLHTHTQSELGNKVWDKVFHTSSWQSWHRVLFCVEFYLNYFLSLLLSLWKAFWQRSRRHLLSICLHLSSSSFSSLHTHGELEK
jgi:hypothetical protein